jgi:hypothetical protein
MSSIRITIKPKGPDTWKIGEQGFSCTTLDNARIQELKNDIQDSRWNIPESKQLLWFGTKKLADNRERLGAAGIVYNSTVHLRELVRARLFFPLLTIMISQLASFILGP